MREQTPTSDNPTPPPFRPTAAPTSSTPQPPTSVPVAREDSPATRPTPKPFTAIGSTPAPIVRPVPQAQAPTAAPIVPPPIVSAPSQSLFKAVETPASAPAPRRRWPLLLLALLTVAASGALSWGVATWVNDADTPSAAIAADSSDPQAEASPDATAQQAIEDPDEPTPSIATQSAATITLGEEPFARAAEIIRPSVVQLTLAQGLGTGVVINEDGTILTAAHVVGNATDVRVTFFDGSSVDGVVVGADSFTDVAVVKVDPTGRTLVPATIADGDDVRVGQLAVAVGSPFGFDQTVTAGIISAVDRIVNEVSMVQTDAPINPGNSGGPLINLAGEVVGINDLIFTESGSNAGVGFAISIDLAIIIAEQLLDGEEPRFALLGVSTTPASNGERGAQVQSVQPGSAADGGGIEAGDIIVGLNGANTRGTSELRAQILDQAPGSEVEITVIRDGAEQDLTVILGQSGT